jgi:hypothetical protein
MKEHAPGCCAECSSYLFDHVVLDTLDHIDQTFGRSREVPKLAPIG